MNPSGPSPVPYSQPLLDAVSLFEELRIGYALVGGVAAMYYGRARFTEDLDFVAMSGHMDILARADETMRRFNFDPNCTWKLYHGSGVEVDLWKDDHCDEIVSRALEAELAGRTVRIAEPHDLIAMKLRAGRLQDDYDVSEIIRGTSVDEEVVRSRVTAEQLAHFISIKKRVG